MIEIHQVLKKLPEMSEDESGTLAHAVTDIAESCEKIIQLKNKLITDLSSEQIREIVDDIREELRHILYHVKNAKVFRILTE